MARTGFNVGLSGQQAEASEILILESHGAFIFWRCGRYGSREAIWRDVLRAAVTGEADDGLVSYRLALVGFIAATILFLAGSSQWVCLLFSRSSISYYFMQRILLWQNTPRRAAFLIFFRLGVRGANCRDFYGDRNTYATKYRCIGCD